MIFMKYFYFFVLLFVILLSCNQENTTQNLQNIIRPEYAKGFFIENNENYKKISVLSPWQGADNVILNYYLVDSSQTIPDSLNNEIFIQIPIKKAVYLSTTYLGYIELLDERNSIVGISGTKYVYDSIVNKMIDNGLISEVGFEQSLDIEKIIELQPDVVFAYDITGSLQSKYDMLKKLGINVVLVGEYLENHPLGRAEWLKFFASFFQTDSVANRLFSGITANYIDLQKSISDTNNKVGVILNTPFQGIWYLPGGNSYMAQLINDAGGNYLYKNKNSSESFSVSLEDVFMKDDSIDILLNPGQVNSIEDILNIDKRLDNVTCIKSGDVYNNNKRVTALGGNDFWESGVVCPDKILSDLIIVFRNDTASFENMKYYKKISNK